MSTAKQVIAHVLERIREHVPLEEALGEGDGPFLALRHASSGADVGKVRIFRGEPLERVVIISLAVDRIGLDAHTLFAFTPPESALPHFTVEAVLAGSMCTLHLGLLPRVDLGASVAYLERVLQPLTSAYEVARGLAGFQPAQMSLRQYALMSPWNLGLRGDAPRLAELLPAVDDYVGHWLALLTGGLPAEAVTASPAQLRERDRLNREAIFNPETDPVWRQMDRLLGVELSGRLRDVLKAPGADEAR